METYNDGPLQRPFMTSVYASWRKEIITFGGYKRVSLVRSNDVHALNIDSKCWTKLQMRGKLPQPRIGHSALLRGTKMYLYGGHNIGVDHGLGELWVAELAAFCHPSWSVIKIKGPSISARINQTLNVLHGVLVLFGGYAGNEDVSRDLEVYLPESKMWQGRHQPRSPVGVHEDLHKSGSRCVGVTTANGILYFTEAGIFLVSEGRAQ